MFTTNGASYRIMIIFVIIIICSTKHDTNNKNFCAMGIGWQIYFVGYFVALWMGVRSFREKDERILASDFFACLLLSLLSWISVLALWVGENIKYAEEHRNDDIDLEDDDNLN